MLTNAQINQVARISGARDIEKVETDILLTMLLQLFHERGLLEHLAFKGGTMLRKMIFGQNGRLSTDLDFTCFSDISKDEMSMMIAEATNAEYRGLKFELDMNDWYETDDGCASGPKVLHAERSVPLEIKIQVSFREKPILPVVVLPQIVLPFFRFLDFTPTDVPCMALEEVLSEKIRAAFERDKIRDLHDLSEIGKQNFDRETVRSLAAWKLWRSGKLGLSYEYLLSHMEDADYDEGDLTSLLRRNQSSDLPGIKRAVADYFRFLAQLTPAEAAVAADAKGRDPKVAEGLLDALAGRVQLGNRPAAYPEFKRFVVTP